MPFENWSPILRMKASAQSQGRWFCWTQHGREANDAAGAYWRYEKVLRGLESDIHSVPGATGAIYAVRRSLFVPLTQGTLLDDVAVPMKIVLGGHRVILDPSARAYDSATNSAECEYHRKKRTCTGNYQLLAQMPELLLPWRNPIFVQFVSHKVGRLLVPYGLAALFISNLFLLRDLYLVAFDGAGVVLRHGSSWPLVLLPRRGSSLHVCPDELGGIGRTSTIRSRDQRDLEPHWIAADTGMTPAATSRAVTPEIRTETISDYQAFLDLEPAWNRVLEESWDRSPVSGARLAAHVVGVLWRGQHPSYRRGKRRRAKSRRSHR